MFSTKKIQSQMSYSVLVVSPLHQYCLNNGRTADGSSEFTYSGSSGSSVERDKKGVPYSSAQTHSKLSSPFPLTGFLGTLLKAGTSESGKVLSYWDPR